MNVSNKITAEELRALARERAIDGYSQMWKAELRVALAPTGVIFIDECCSSREKPRLVSVKAKDDKVLDFTALLKSLGKL